MEKQEEKREKTSVSVKPSTVARAERTAALVGIRPKFSLVVEHAIKFWADRVLSEHEKADQLHPALAAILPTLNEMFVEEHRFASTIEHEIKRYESDRPTTQQAQASPVKESKWKKPNRRVV